MLLTPSSSTATLVQKPIQKPAPKDYEAALASLQSSIGFAPAPTVAKKRSSVTSSSSSSSTPARPTSASALTPTSGKDYEATLAAMQSSYGFRDAPIISRYTPKSPSPLSRLTRNRTSPPPPPPPSSSQPAAPRPTSQKDYASALAVLSSSWGHGSIP